MKYHRTDSPMQLNCKLSGKNSWVILGNINFPNRWVGLWAVSSCVSSAIFSLKSFQCQTNASNTDGVVLTALELVLRKAVALWRQELLLLLQKPDHLRTPEQRLDDTNVEILDKNTCSGHRQYWSFETFLKLVSSIVTIYLFT